MLSHLRLTADPDKPWLKAEHTETENILALLNLPELLETKTLDEIKYLLETNGYKEGYTTVYTNRILSYAQYQAVNLVTSDGKLIQVEVDNGGKYILHVVVENTSEIAGDCRERLKTAFSPSGEKPFVRDGNGSLIDPGDEGFGARRISGKAEGVLQGILGGIWENASEHFMTDTEYRAKFQATLGQ